MAIESQADELFFGGAAGGGKGLALDTLLPTQTGSVRMGDVQIGDMLFDEKGEICHVIAVSEIQNRACFEVEFDDGTIILSDDVHRWSTLDAKQLMQATRYDPEWRTKRRAKRPSRISGNKSEKFTRSLALRNAAKVWEVMEFPAPTVKNTSEILATLRTSCGRANHAIAVALPLDLPHADLPIEPYLLGLWLGDGNTSNAAIGMSQVDMDEVCSYVETPISRTKLYGHPYKTPYKTVRFDKLQKTLRSIGLLGNKHIPAAYLRASIHQRQELLRGLLDTDGHASASGQIELGLSLKVLADDARELISSLGIKVGMTEKPTIAKPSFRMKFCAQFAAFKLKRKLERQRFSGFRPTTGRRYIVDVRAVVSVPTRCIEVDSPSHLFLAGRQMVPTHNSSLILGAAITEHFNSIIFRREYAQLKGLKDEAQKLLANHARYNGTENIWRFPDGQWIEFGGVQLASDVNKWQGRASDLRAFDELPHFTRAQYEFLKGWRRTERPGQRTRIICTGNPPTDAEGDWVIDYWAPWLDPLHPNPAKDGELRWFATINGKDTEVPTGDPFFIEGEEDAITPTSRTFIRARVQDNPYYMRSGYMAVLQALPEPLRSQMLKGEFSAGREDNAWQVIPSAWVIAAQARWTPDGHNGKPMDALGVDVARGGKDNTVLTPRHGPWFAEQQAHPGQETPDGQAVIGLILQALASSPVPAEPGHQTAINMDTIAVGSSPQDIGKEYGLNIIPCVGSHASEGRDRSGQFGFINARSEWLWMLREALDPVLGDNLALPPSPKLRADLTAPRWKVTVRGIQVESKEDIAKRIMRSTDYGDSLVYAHAQAQSSAQAWMAYLREQAEARAQQREGV